MNDYPTLVPLGPAARILRVPQKWLREQALAGDIPHLRAGRAILIHVPTVAKLLVDRAKQPGQKGVRDAH
jgi:hypothetical protein